MCQARGPMGSWHVIQNVLQAQKEGDSARVVISMSRGALNGLSGKYISRCARVVSWSLW